MIANARIHHLPRPTKPWSNAQIKFSINLIDLYCGLIKVKSD